MRKIQRWILIPSVVPPHRPPQERIICLLLSTHLHPVLGRHGICHKWQLRKMFHALMRKTTKHSSLCIFPDLFLDRKSKTVNLMIYCLLHNMFWPSGPDHVLSINLVEFAKFRLEFSQNSWCKFVLEQINAKKLTICSEENRKNTSSVLSFMQKMSRFTRFFG